jgi:hypothetical protein
MGIAWTIFVYTFMYNCSKIAKSFGKIVFLRSQFLHIHNAGIALWK